MITKENIHREPQNIVFLQSLIKKLKMKSKVLPSVPLKLAGVEILLESIL